MALPLRAPICSRGHHAGVPWHCRRRDKGREAKLAVLAASKPVAVVQNEQHQGTWAGGLPTPSTTFIDPILPSKEHNGGRDAQRASAAHLTSAKQRHAAQTPHASQRMRAAALACTLPQQYTLGAVPIYAAILAVDPAMSTRSTG
jgi:hypothetical protein